MGNIILTPNQLESLLNEESVEGYENYSAYADIETGDYDYEKGAMTEFLITLENTETGELWEAYGGYFTGVTGCKINRNLEFKPVIEEKPTNKVPFVSEVETFNKTFGKPNFYTPNIPAEEWQSDFVYNFILEEAAELKEAYQNKDIVGVLDAILDITYVATGNGAMLFGLKDKIMAGYAEVQASNMSKSCATIEEAEQTVKVRSEQQGVPCHYEELDGRYIVYRTHDRKVMKSINYFPPNLKQFFTQEELNNI